jgi:hypothetical protein
MVEMYQQVVVIHQLQEQPLQLVVGVVVHIMAQPQ